MVEEAEERQPPQYSSSEVKVSDAELFEKVRSMTESSRNEELIVSANANLMREKINKLEDEIEKFKKRNAELAERVRKLDIERRLLDTERRTFENERREAVAQLKELHDEEMRKLRAEKRIFEQYRQAIKERPSRKEREEVERLTIELRQLGEEMKLRETRWTANNNRLKERIETLEREKSQLKESLKLAEKLRIESLIKNSTADVISGLSFDNNIFRQPTTVRTSLPDRLMTNTVGHEKNDNEFHYNSKDETPLLFSAYEKNADLDLAKTNLDYELLHSATLIQV